MSPGTVFSSWDTSVKKTKICVLAGYHVFYTYNKCVWEAFLSPFCRIRN